MSTLIEKIREDQLHARKNNIRPARVVLTTLLGEAEMVGKNDGNRQSTDAEVLKVISKFVQNAKDTITALPAGSEQIAVLQAEIDVLSVYLPAMMSQEQLDAVISARIAELGAKANPGSVIAHLKEHYPNQYDAKTIFDVVKEALKPVPVVASVPAGTDTGSTVDEVAHDDAPQSPELTPVPVTATRATRGNRASRSAT